MEKYAVIKLASKQYLVHEGDVIELERQEKPLKVGVLFYCDGEKNFIGEPDLSDITVKAVVVEEKLGKKVRVARFKKKSRYERVRGHRQPISIIKIEKIGSGKEEKESGSKVKSSEPVEQKKSEVSSKKKVIKDKAGSSVETKKTVKKIGAVSASKKATPGKTGTNLKGSK